VGQTGRGCKIGSYTGGRSLGSLSNPPSNTSKVKKVGAILEGAEGGGELNVLFGGRGDAIVQRINPRQKRAEGYDAISC